MRRVGVGERRCRGGGKGEGNKEPLREKKNCKGILILKNASEVIKNGEGEGGTVKKERDPGVRVLIACMVRLEGKMRGCLGVYL